ncbi:YHYH protein [Phenylobacterium sp.]|jgi:hypothetical protein|uniref:YHYH protein n=1 Tax=Phenylobacterium sp. TaxID=1871053 RepID=UPI002F42B4AC
MSARLVPLLSTAALAWASAIPAAVQAHPDHLLPLGDGHISTTPQRGYVLGCPANPGGPGGPPGGGAFRAGEWIKDGHWDPDAKPVVEGQVEWPNAAITISVENDKRVIRANSLPRHPTGEFPIKAGTRAYDYDRNPNHIAERQVLLTLPAQPVAADRPACVPMGMIGFAVSGVAIFNAFDATLRDAPAYEIQDRCNGHPERTSQYHYHNWSPCLAQGTGKPDPQVPVGWMLDGFPILGPYDAKGVAITDADLDECHGRTGPVKSDGRTVVTYHYRFTLEFPYTIGCFRGAPVRLPRPQGPPPDGRGPPGGRPPPS